MKEKIILVLSVLMVLFGSYQAFATIRVSSLHFDGIGTNNPVLTAQVFKQTNVEGEMTDSGASAPITITGSDLENLMTSASQQGAYNQETITNLIANTMSN